AADSDTLGSWLLFDHVGLWRVLIAPPAGLLAGGVLRTVLIRQRAAHKLIHDVSDLNQYANGQRTPLPTALIRRYGVFPDVGAHSPVQPSSLISHAMLSNKGVDKIMVAKRAEADIIDEEGYILYHKGEILRDDDGEPIMEKKPMMDT